MSFQIRNIREIPGDSLAKFAHELSKKLSRFLTKDQLELLEDKEDVYIDGQDFDSVVKFHDELLSTKQFTFNTQYFPASYPDNNRCQIWIQGRSLGNTMPDLSLTGNTITLNGDPTLIDGTPFDYGIHGDGVKSIALRLNRPTSDFENEEYIRVAALSNNRAIEGAANGMSYFVRFRLKDLAAQGGIARHLFLKMDNDNPDDAVRAYVDSNGRLIFRMIKGGVQFNSQTATSTIVADTIYEVWITFTISGNVTHIYVNNVDKSLTDPGADSTWHTPVTDHDWSVMSRGGTNTSGFAYGDLYDFMLLRGTAVTNTEVSRHYTNKWSIANTAFGQIMVSNYWATYDEAGNESFTTTSFTSTSFTT